jgi:hypothetical protein
MVDSLLEIEDRYERTRQAKAVIAVMGNINPMLRDTDDFKHKLWDHLFIMSDFRLDVDSPYPQPSRQDLTLTPQKLRYPQSRIVLKHYGKYLHQFVEQLVKESKTQPVTHEIVNIARFMRNKGFEFNNEHPNNEAIVRDINLLAGGDHEMDLSAITQMRNEHRSAGQQRVQKRGKQQAQKHHNGRKSVKSARPQQRHNQHK